MTATPDLTVRQGQYGPSAPRSTGMVRVVSWNIQFGVEVDAAALALAEHPHLRDADIILLQEMDEVGTARLAELLSLNFVYAAPGVHQQTGRNFGNAVLAPWPLGEPKAVLLPHKASVRGQSRVLVLTEVMVSGRAIDAGSVHTEVPSMGSAKRLRQFDEIAAAAARRVAARAIVGGDFNTVSRRGIAALTERMGAVGAVRVSTGAGTTLRRSGQEFTLDHIFARGLEPVATGVVTGSMASDHRPLWVTLRADDREVLQSAGV
jgi:endonuclease/exonuclease/phosphatase (EEP) superfamily protein YafD